MATRKTIIIDGPLLKALYALQAKRIKESNQSISFSRVINDICKKQLRV
jgi:hypothetical protein